MKQSLSEG